MSNFLAELLNAKQPLFDKTIADLEAITKDDGEDVRLIAEIKQTIRNKTEELGLDPDNVTDQELYQALINKAKEHDLNLAKQIGAEDPDDVFAIIPLIPGLVDKTDMPKGCWAMKKSVAKDFLRKTPPKKIMELLGYSSVESMLKKENIFELFGALRFAENGDWLTAFNKNYETLEPSDFEHRDIELVIMPHDRWGDIAAKFIKKKRHVNTHSKELGAVYILPPTDGHMKGITTKLVSLTYHYYNEVRLYSAFFKLKQMDKNFGKVVVETLNADPDLGSVLAGKHIHWRVIQRYFGKLKDEEHPEIFEPHIQPEDLHWRKAEEVMYALAPEMEFWRDLDFVGYVADDGRPLTLSLMDVTLSYSNEIPFEERYIYHFRESLWNEIFIRYMGKESLAEQVLEQLDNDMVQPENL